MSQSVPVGEPAGDCREQKYLDATTTAGQTTLMSRPAATVRAAPNKRRLVPDSAANLAVYPPPSTSLAALLTALSGRALDRAIDAQSKDGTM
ncbi:hypothetical protein ABZ356_10995 [Micromonospora zamorensis]|uniref:hypothetical protein n=1 Tax=Micromonospora zamorensis TaxID=709883 RepID=UPI0033F12723